MATNPVELSRITFASAFSEEATPTVAAAPGRVNLIGEHTDYNDGYVLPMAINKRVAVAFAVRSDDVIRGHSAAFDESWETEIGKLNAPGGSNWFDYIAAVAWAMLEAGLDVTGIDMAIAGDVPVGAGLASSAALEMAVARAFACTSNASWEPVRMATLCQHAENAYVGVNCGIMDQFAAAVCAQGCALLLDCRSLEHDAVPIPMGAQFVVMDTGVRRKLAASEYNDRRQSCELATKAFRNLDPMVRSLRDVGLQAFDAAAASLDGLVLNRATHVVNEIRRPLQMSDALRKGDLNLAGQLMDDSHESLRNLYEVSCTELDLITEIARRHEACLGARMTGAGFGGCAVALVTNDKAHDFVTFMGKEYRAAGYDGGSFDICTPSDGATLIS
jgi:galactokinase